jgi:hypothetical protein
MEIQIKEQTKINDLIDWVFEFPEHEGQDRRAA